MEKLFTLLDHNFDEIVAIRRHLHEYPELSFEEVETPAYIAAFHRALGHDVREQVGERGVVATLRGESLVRRWHYELISMHWLSKKKMRFLINRK